MKLMDGCDFFSLFVLFCSLAPTSDHSPRSLVRFSSTGRVAEQMGNLEHAESAYENALRHNPMSLPGLTQVAGIARIRENYTKVRPFSHFSHTREIIGTGLCFLSMPLLA